MLIYSSSPNSPHELSAHSCILKLRAGATGEPVGPEQGPRTKRGECADGLVGARTCLFYKEIR